MGDETEKGKTGVNVTISEKSADKIVKAVTDLFSPITESMGLVGDHIRIYRERSVEDALKRAKEIAVEEGLTPEIPPPKFIVPYLEAVSVEDETDDSLREKWARLLLNAGAKPDSFAFFARTLLSELTPEEAALLDYLVSETDVLSYSSYDDYAKKSQAQQQDAANACEKTLLRMKAGDMTASEARKEIIAQVSGRFMLQATFRTPTQDVFHQEGDTAYITNQTVAKIYWSFEILQGRKIVDTWDVSRYRMNHDLDLNMNMGYFTRLGFGVVRKLYKAA